MHGSEGLTSANSSIARAQEAACPISRQPRFHTDSGTGRGRHIHGDSADILGHNLRCTIARRVVVGEGDGCAGGYGLGEPDGGLRQFGRCELSALGGELVIG